MTTSTIVRSISAPIWELLRSASGPVLRLGMFRRALDLLIDDQVVAFVLPPLGNGPFHLVVQQLPVRSFPKECNLHWQADCLELGPWQLRFPTTLQVWNPRPAWERLDLEPARLAALRKFVLQAGDAEYCQHSPLAPLLAGRPLPPVTSLLAALQRGLLADIEASSALLAGWGPGLTPAGDDFLAGIMLGWRAQGRGAEIPESIYRGAAPATNRISRAFLAAARDGLVDERWQLLLTALSADQNGEWQASAQQILAFGATSGLDMLLGFLQSFESRAVSSM